ncbi:unnamed protein product (macronuclear) [Paramecium tetraurelia]|uniref:TNFR-Cys domain-containing protein n=1 Tax=Paramecium tetraurelia TaxID=5888 RepID=A0CGB6_PARTE|nr:uncharacterized protein GSPATT00007273001 [Paramecium tetraurelia]CAK69833.1 unnamed protein product [Paramecium tetraurelia]|eukprot:XP_001437230.1 hypothetical protein (macronuclear) [Paramecium tetraurelia strain d4-2]
MRLLIVLIYTTHQTLIYQFYANSYNRDGWQDLGGDTIFTSCGGIQYFGSSWGGTVVNSKLFDVPEDHSHIRVDCQILNIDGDTSVPVFEVDYRRRPDFQSTFTSQNQVCGNSQQEYIQSTTLIIQHNRRTVWMFVETFNGGGLISLKLSTVKCQYDCDGCIENQQIFCLKWKLHQYSFTQKYLTNFDGWVYVSQYSDHYYCGYCQYLLYQQIQYSTKLPLHKDVFIRFFKADGYTIIVDYQQGIKTISSFYQQVEILIENHYDPILILKIKTQPISDYGQIRDFDVFYTLPEKMLVNYLNQGCQEQIEDKCLICQEGWIQDKFLETCHPICPEGTIEDQYCSLKVIQPQSALIVSKLKEGCLEQIDNTCLICKEGWVKDKFLETCHPICGDGIIQGQEECDDANLISNDSCYQCKYSCINFCKTCVFGICYECVFGFDLNADLNCVSFCGDGNVVPYSDEQCDLNDNEEWDHCQDCRFVLIANCKRQLLSMCLVCELGYQLLENACFPHCGDKYVLQQYEECDDGNLQPYDGCFECKFQCAEDCNICYLGQCLLKCEDGYRFLNNRCLSICGDQIVTKEEDCDDGNKIQFDGCFDCKYSYSCPENCYECYQGICLKCNDQYQLLISNQCKLQLQCGDGLLQQQEECDDGNSEVLDGCKDCLIEQNWICTAMIRDSPSQCAFIQAPKLVISYLNMTSNSQYISIQFNQKVKIYSTQKLSETINCNLSNLNKKNWNSSLYIIQDVGSDVSFGEYIIEIEIQQLLEFRPILTIEVNQTVANYDNSFLDDFTKSITLQYPQYLGETQKEYAYKLKNLNMYLIYGLSGITCANLLLGNGDLFIEILAILQSQQYLRYINLQFPQNLEIYFSVNDLITIQPLLDFIDFSQIFSLIELQQNQQPYSEGKFAVYQENPTLIINLSFQILQCLIFLFLILLCNLIKKVIYKWIFCQRNFYYAQTLSLQINPKIVFKCQESFYKICLKLLNLKKYMSFQGLQKALILNGWDMTFKILLYTRTFSTNNYLDIVQLIITCVLLILYVTILLDSFKSKQTFSKLKRFEILIYGRQFFFLFYLIFCQNSQILQLGLLFMTNILQISLLFNYRHIQKRKNYIVQMVVEISVLTFMLSSFLYIQECNEYFNEEKKIILGWIHITILSTGIIVETIFIIKDLYQAWKRLYKRKKPQCARSQLFI